MKIDIRAKPKQLVNWIEKDGVVSLKVRKFKSRIGRWFCHAFKKPEYFMINLDELGTFIWKRCNGEKTVETILHELEKNYDEKMMKERLYYFLSALKRYGYIEFDM